MAENVGGIFYSVTADTSKLVGQTRVVERETGKMAGSFSKMAAAISAALSAIAIEGVISKIVNAQRQFDVMFASLKTMTGGAEQAGTAFERLRKFAAQTPYTLEQSVSGFIKLKALGIDPSERAMTSFGNTASAMGKSLTQMIEAVADASTGEFERLKEFGIKARTQGDKVALTFRGTTTEVQNSATAITEYLVKIGETDFSGAMSERMKTLDGDVSNLQDSMEALYLTVSQSGAGDAIAAGVRKATEAIQELTTSVKEGGLTSYFDDLKPYIAAAELAVVALSGAIAGRLVASFIASAVQAYAAATAMGAATVAARGFTAVVATLGGPIGIAITGLALLALNWDKVSGSARSAAEISEQSAQRIAEALRNGPVSAAASLQEQIDGYKSELKKAQAEVDKRQKPTIYGGRSTPEQIKVYQDRVDALRDAIGKTQAAMDGLHGGAGRGKVNPALVVPDPDKPGGSGGGKKASDIPYAITDPQADMKQRFLQSEKDFEAAQKHMDEMAAEAAENDKRRAEQRQQGEYFALASIAAGDPVAQLEMELMLRSAKLDEYASLDLAKAQLYADAKVALEQQTADKIAEIRDRDRLKQASNNAASVAMLADTTAQMFSILEQSGRERSALAKALFLVSKGLAVAEILMNTEIAASKAGAQLGIFGLPMASMIRATGYASAAMVGGMAVGEAISGRQYGGSTVGGSLYRVNETGRPEMFTAANGSQYMLPTTDGRVTAADKIGGGGITVQVINNHPTASVAATTDDRGQIVQIAINEVAGQISGHSGPVWQALRGTTNVTPRL